MCANCTYQWMFSIQLCNLTDSSHVLGYEESSEYYSVFDGSERCTFRTKLVDSQ